MAETTFSLYAVQLFGVTVGVTLLLLLLLTRIPHSQANLLRREPGRSFSYSLPLRLGGLALLGGFLVTFFFDQRLVFDLHLQYLLVGGLLAFGFGIIDDFFPLAWGWQLGGQLTLGLLLFLAGMSIEKIHFGDGLLLDFTVVPGLSFIITVFWVVLVMNAVNWMDGVDGLMGGVMCIAWATLFTLSLRPEVNQPTIALLTVMLFGSTLAFLLFNWSPAKIMAGTGGVAFLGFMLAALSVYAGTKVATALLVLGVPILDAFSVIINRLCEGRSMFRPDEEHLHHLLLRLGWSTRTISLLYSIVTGFLALLALTTRQWGKIEVFVITLSFFTGGVLLIQWLLARKKHLMRPIV